MIVALINLIIYIVILGLVFYVLQWAITAIPIPDPFAMVLKVILVLIALVVVLNLLFGMLGGGSIHLPEFKP